MKKEYVFALILAILCFLGGNYYSTYNQKEQTLFVYKGTATERENTDSFQGLNYSDVFMTMNKNNGCVLNLMHSE